VFEKTFHHCAVGLAHVAIDGTFIRVNKTLCNFLGYNEHELTKLSFKTLTISSFLHEELMHIERLLKGEIDSYALEKQYLCKNGKPVWGRLTVSLVRDVHDNPDYFISVVENIDDKKRIENELYRLEALLSKIVSSFSKRTLIWVASSDFSKLMYVNNGYTSIYGYDPKAMYHDTFAFLAHVHPDDALRVASTFATRPLKSWDLEYRIVDAIGDIKYLHDRGCLIYDAYDKQTLILGTADDVSKEKSHENELRRAVSQLELLSKTDTLTGLANRRELLAQLTEDIERTERGQAASTLIYLDINNFKDINDVYGHKIGDKALQCFADRMSVLLRESDRFGRIGGDEFVILLYGTSQAETKRFLKRLTCTPLHIEGNERESIPISFSFGSKEWNKNIKSVQEWLDLADAAMYEQKHLNKMQKAVPNKI
jgi:diguanylate cyclase (GGDEF)-like protein/PAS domain S-box-containing protein